MPGDKKEYLGDAVYARIDDYGAVWLTTDNGGMSTNVICLEPEVLVALKDYLKRHNK